jgi:hypothetical protein
MFERNIIFENNFVEIVDAVLRSSLHTFLWTGWRECLSKFFEESGNSFGTTIINFYGKLSESKRGG